MKKSILLLACVAAMSINAFAATPEEVKRETPKYESPDQIIESIVAQYPGKTVFVDLWATWCGPCVRAMETIKPLKPWMEENNIVKVYITNQSSDKAKWEEMIGDIGGNHYLLNEDEWKAVRDKFGFRGIPTYMIFDKKGEKTYQTSGYPGNDTMKAEFEKAL